MGIEIMKKNLLFHETVWRSRLIFFPLKKDCPRDFIPWAVGFGEAAPLRFCYRFSFVSVGLFWSVGLPAWRAALGWREVPAEALPCWVMSPCPSGAAAFPCASGL
jgi:hypothetical protein